ncbi:MAG: NAD(P)-dependent glycerol-3-phosphate dehydrogenase [Magnetospirillum sp.]|jgi:glycerol-3-phosphate dehydrogenase (NAD(P)+)|nr:NAD(P)-dependent glycerol-3-phosphate dehydrogenase [Magnetospirillum sp.]
MSRNFKTIAVIGAGAWGTALAQTAARAGLKPTLWAYEPATVAEIAERHTNSVFLPGVALDPTIAATADLAAAVADADIVLAATPAQHLRATLQRLKLPTDVPLILATKGIELGTGALMSTVAQAAAPGHPIAILTGPTFAREVALAQPTAVTLAASDATLGRALAQALATPHFRIYRNDDVVGAQVGGAVKNVVALGCGIVAGLALGDNARAALMTRGLAEMVRLGVALGGRAETLMGLSGLGDLALTCNNDQSRNMRFGRALGRGLTPAQALADPALGLAHAVIEGVEGAASVGALARERRVDMPIVAALDAILHHGASVAQTVDALLNRPLKEE